ncbi:hypothetical protein Syun_004654 [Stephania yunnanensis]|uniref:Uncharacterized protein n=1 Tax=Stephania yunnanensis TaxID=152371 RepID=A0AAP0L3G0_9MAGN
MEIRDFWYLTNLFLTTPSTRTLPPIYSSPAMLMRSSTVSSSSSPSPSSQLFDFFPFFRRTGFSLSLSISSSTPFLFFFFFFFFLFTASPPFLGFLFRPPFGGLVSNRSLSRFSPTETILGKFDSDLLDRSQAFTPDIHDGNRRFDPSLASSSAMILISDSKDVIFFERFFRVSSKQNHYVI